MGKRTGRHRLGRLGHFAPRFWLSWLVVGFTWLLAQLPDRLQRWLTRGLARVAVTTNSSRIRTIRRNLELCFPELDAAQREKLVAENMYSTLLMIFDLVNLIWDTNKANLAKCQLVGEHHLRAALSADKPLLIISGHATAFILAFVKLSEITPYSIVYRRMDNPVLEAQLYQRAAKKYPIETIHRKEITHMLKQLSANGLVVIVPDQDFGPKRSAFVPFFGIATATLTAIPQYAQRADANVMMLYSHRQPDGGYVAELWPVLENYPSGDDLADTTLWSDWLEQQIRNHPADYMWLHKRFKTRPEGEQKLY